MTTLILNSVLEKAPLATHEIQLGILKHYDDTYSLPKSQHRTGRQSVLSLSSEALMITDVGVCS